MTPARPPRSLLTIALAFAAALASPAAVAQARPAAPDTSSYDGVGAWIDIFDASAWANPAATVQALRARGVHTLYLETGNSSQRTSVVRPAGARAFIDEAHRQGMRIVAWYLPSLVSPARDHRRIRAAIALRTATGGQFDGFALDIESSAVRGVANRTRRLLALSRKLRASVGPAYPLGAIIPSPRGMQLKPTYWPRFPYRALGGLYDAFLPMIYSSYRVSGARPTYAYTVKSVEILRASTLRPTIPIHLVGGIADDLTAAEQRAVGSVATAEGVAGLSLYGLLPQTTRGWSTLRAAATSTA